MNINLAFEMSDTIYELFIEKNDAFSNLESLIKIYPDAFGPELKAACLILRENIWYHVRGKLTYGVLDSWQDLYEEGKSFKEVAEQRALQGDPLAISYLEWKPDPEDEIFEALKEAAGEAHPNWHKVPFEGDEDDTWWQPMDRAQPVKRWPDLVAWFRITHPEETAEIEKRILAEHDLSG